MSDNIEIKLTPHLALTIIAERGCEHFSTGPKCLEYGRHPLAYYGADLACASCVAKLALKETEDD